jgi:hypothetical protein
MIFYVCDEINFYFHLSTKALETEGIFRVHKGDRDKIKVDTIRRIKSQKRANTTVYFITDIYKTHSI